MNNTSLNAIAALIPRWYGVKVLLDDQAIADKRFSGIIYKNRPLSDFLEMLRGTMDANFYMMERKTRPSFTWMGCKRHSVTLT